jgi:purine-binding chemotaxis protein CheW
MGEPVIGMHRDAASTPETASSVPLTVPSGQDVQCLSFLVHDEAYALPLLRVREIVRFSGCTRVPRVRPHVRGVVNLRGTVVPVVDLAVWLGQPETVVMTRTCLLVVEATGQAETAAVGLVIDGVDQVLDLRSEALEPPPSFGTLMPPQFIAGMTRAGERFVYLLDMDRLLAEGGLLQGTSARGHVPSPVPKAHGDGR